MIRKTVFIVCSKSFYSQVKQYSDALKQAGFDVIVPNSLDNPGKEQEVLDAGTDVWRVKKREWLFESRNKIKKSHILLCLNFEHPAHGPGYIGEDTALEMLEGYMQNKLLFTLYPVREQYPLGEKMRLCNPYVASERLRTLPMSVPVATLIQSEAEKYFHAGRQKSLS